MAVLTYAQMSDLFLDRVQANVATDAPVSAAEILRFLNEAYVVVYEAEGGSVKQVASATAWTGAEAATKGVVTGILTDVKNIVHLFASLTSGSIGDEALDTELDPVEMGRIRALKSSAGFGTYTRPQCYAVERQQGTATATVGLLRLEFWPVVTGFFLPTHYVPMFTPLTGGVDVADLTDLGSRDVPLIAAMRVAPLLGRPELVPSIALDISERNSQIMERKLKAWVSGEQDQD